MLLQQLCTLTVFLLAAALLGRAQNATQPQKNLTCYDGTHEALRADFPTGFKTCRADGRFSNKISCAEYRFRNFQTSSGFVQVGMYCGSCSHLVGKVTACRECSSDFCNDNFAKELAPVIPEMRSCYVSATIGRTMMPKRVLCLSNDSCSTSSAPDQHTMVGCKGHCEESKWGHCEYCDTDLCNTGGDTFEIPMDQLAENKPLFDFSDQAVCVSSPIARPTVQVAVLAVVAALALRQLHQ